MSTQGDLGPDRHCTITGEDMSAIGSRGSFARRVAVYTYGELGLQGIDGKGVDANGPDQDRCR
jgi:hypothetical protein